MTTTDPTALNPVHVLREEFRRHLDVFYAGLKLAPPYESVEKAIRTLMTGVQALPTEEQHRIVSDPERQWQHFRRAFESSGLVRKHRGIIVGLARNRSALDLPPEYDHFLSLFHA